MPRDTITFRSPMPVSADDLFAWHARPAAFLRLNPPWERVRVLATDGPFGDGYRVTMRTPLVGPLSKSWVAEIHGTQPGRQFRDRQAIGPFAFWDHTHSMIPDGPGRSILEDHIEYELPLGWAGRLFGTGMVRDRLARMFAYRHTLTARDLRRQSAQRDRLTVAVTGSTGLVGSELCLFLAAGGHDVVRFVRGTPKASRVDDGTRSVRWDPEATVDPTMLDGVDAVVHLAGENLAAGRWTAAQKARIRTSRTGPTRRLAEAIARLDRKPRVFVSASAIGIYGHRGDEELTETSPSRGDFLATVCTAWEEATEPASAAGVRVVNARFGAVVSPRGGALGHLLPAFRAGIGATLGDGRQWLSWVSVHDVVAAIHHAITTDVLMGPVNIVAPFPVTNREFGRVLAQALHRPYLFAIPEGALRLLFGEVAEATLLASTRALPGKLTESGFVFEHPDLKTALHALLGDVRF